ncbi:glucose 1-dehydrogenase [bacterium LRH843]|nr:glucose 1-dehydrogenase [bacterium LRH843]
MDLKGKTAIITGGGTGIGRATALMLAERGADIVINYSRSEESAIKTRDEVQSYGVKCIVVQADVSKDDEVRQLANKTIETFGRIDIVVNNAGTTDFVALDDLEGLKEEYWDRAFNTNAKGAFLVSRACAEQLKANKGCIVNIASIAGMTGQGSSIAYAASKAALLSLTKSLALVLAPEVRVNAVNPGIVITRWVNGKEDHVTRYGEATPLGRVATPEDVAEVVVSLVASAGLVTGQSLTIDGGVTLV